MSATNAMSASSISPSVIQPRISAILAVFASGWPGIEPVTAADERAMNTPGIARTPHNGKQSSPKASPAIDNPSAVDALVFG
jgi:hypothetical protein